MVSTAVPAPAPARATAPAKPLDGTRAALVETHVSVVTFIGDRAYKLKKPVTLDFVDQGSREARERLCHREVELNRRLAPDVYLGVADLVGEGGTVLDHLVVMRRMPPSRRLSTLVASGACVDHELRRVARTVAAFHERAETSPAISASATAAALASRWGADLAQTRIAGAGIVDPDLLDRADVLARRFLAGRGALFASRIAAGRVRDGHGDLLADDIFCLDDGPRILDCIEFDDGLRHADVVADVAFLAMDLERLGHAEQARRFVAAYREFSGDPVPVALLDYHVAHRALVRCKVACVRSRQGDAEAAGEARRLLLIAYSHLLSARVVLVLVGGLPGTGKSTLARALGGALGWAVLRSDEVRREVTGGAAGAPRAVGYAEGIYSSGATADTYSELVRRSRALLARGGSVILDASWSDGRRREAAALAAVDTASDLVELRCTVPAATASGRMIRRATRGDDASEATPEIAAQMARHVDAWPRAVRLDTSDTPLRSLVRALHVIGASTPDHHP